MLSEFFYLLIFSPRYFITIYSLVYLTKISFLVGQRQNCMGGHIVSPGEQAADKQSYDLFGFAVYVLCNYARYQPFMAGGLTATKGHT